MAAARKVSKARWAKKAWEKAMDAQFEEIAKKHGKEAAEGANYGWGDASGGERVSVATKVYLSGGAKVLQTEATFPSDDLSHSWQDY